MAKCEKGPCPFGFTNGIPDGCAPLLNRTQIHCHKLSLSDAADVAARRQHQTRAVHIRTEVPQWFLKMIQRMWSNSHALHEIQSESKPFARWCVVRMSSHVEMSMKRMYMMMTIALLCAGCVSTPQTKALFTPVGAIGVHSFAPPQKPMNPSEADRLARLMQDREDSQSAQRVN